MDALLFSPLTIRGLTLRNRIVLSPMLTYAATNGYTNDTHLAHLAKFAVGGAASVRGYLEASELGDTGVAGSFEFGLSPRHLVGGRLLAEGYLFYDAGIAASIFPLPGEERRTDLSSAGIAFNLGFDSHYAASVSWAYPLVPAGRTAAGDSRFLFMMRSSW